MILRRREPTRAAFITAALLSFTLLLAAPHLFARQTAAETRTLHVTVETEDGDILSGLGPEAFAVFDDEARARVVSFGREAAPATIGLVLDASGSMGFGRRGNLFEKMRAGLLGFFLLAGRGADEFFVVAFNRQPQLVLSDTNDPKAVVAAIDRLAAAETRGQTALYDALYLALAQASKGRHPKRALVVVTDGRDTGISTFSPAEVRRAVREGDVIVYVVAFDTHTRGGLPSDAPLLGEMAATSGGRVYRVHDEKQLGDALKRVGLELRSQHAVVVAPQQPSRKDGWHEVSVRMAKGRGPDGKLYKLRARTRKGFYWPAKVN